MGLLKLVHYFTQDKLYCSSISVSISAFSHQIVSGIFYRKIIKCKTIQCLSGTTNPMKVTVHFYAKSSSLRDNSKMDTEGRKHSANFSNYYYYPQEHYSYCPQPSYCRFKTLVVLDVQGYRLIIRKYYNHSVIQFWKFQRHFLII